MIIRAVKTSEKILIHEIVGIHLDTFQGYFLTFLGRGFLYQLYRSYCENGESDLLVAMEDSKPVGFLAYSENLSGLYKYMIKKRLFLFAFYSIGAFFRKPRVFLRLVRAFLKPSESIRNEKYVELASIGVAPHIKSRGIGTALIDELKSRVDFQRFSYITLETDAVDNDSAIHFYKKNGFSEKREYETNEGRKMLEFRLYVKDTKEK